MRGRLAIRSIMRPVSAGDMPDVGSSSSRSVGLAGKCDPDLELALLAVREVAGKPRAVVAEMHAMHQLLGARDQSWRRATGVKKLSAPPRRRLHRQPQVLDAR